MRYAIVALSVGVLAFFHVSYALALGNGDVAVVVDVLEELSPARGEGIYYDEEAADDWYEFDQDESGLIPAAGFSRDAWRDTYDKTLKGLIALIPSAEFDAIHEGLKERIDALQGLGERERRELAGEMMERRAALQALRAEGEPYVEAVRPFSRRLRALGRF